MPRTDGGSSVDPDSGDGPGDGERPSLLGRIRSSYARKFLLALLVVVAAVAVAGAVVQVTLADVLREDVNEKLVAQTEAEATGLAEFMASHRTPTFVTSNHPALGGDDPAALRAFLGERRAEALPQTVAALHVVRVDEKTAVASTDDAVDPGDSFESYAWVSTLSFTDFDDVTTSDPYTNRRGERTIAFLSAVEADPSRILVVTVNVSDVDETFSSAIDGGFTQVVDSAGRVVFADRTSALGEPYLGDSDATPAVLDASDRRNSGFLADTRREQTLDGNHVQAYATVDGTDWVLVKHAPADNAYRLASLATWGVVGIVAVALVGVVAIGLTVGRKTTGDLRALSRKADAVAAGDYDVDLSRERRDELGALAAAIATMRDSLVARIRDAEAAEARARSTQRELECKNETVEEQRAVISVLNRVLRHNLRNGGNVILGHVDALEQDPSAEDAAHHRRRIESQISGLLTTAEKAHHVEELVAGRDDELSVVDAAAVLSSELEAVAAANPDVTVETDIRGNAAVRAHETLQVAVTNLVENAIEHSDREEPWVCGSVERVARDGDEWVAVEIADDGPGIPAAEVRALDEGVETALEHASGIGLWLASWLVSAMGGEVTFADREPRGTVVTVYLRPADQTPDTSDDDGSPDANDRSPDEESDPNG